MSINDGIVMSIDLGAGEVKAGSSSGSSLQSMQEQGEKLLSDILNLGKGTIKSAVLVSPQGLPVFHILPEEIDPDSLSAATLASIEALSSALTFLGSKTLFRVDVELEDKSHIVVVPVGDYILAVTTSIRPNLGFIYLILNRYTGAIRQVVEGGSPG